MPLRNRPTVAIAGWPANDNIPLPMCANYRKLSINVAFAGQLQGARRPRLGANSISAAEQVRSKWPITRSGPSFATGGRCSRNRPPPPECRRRARSRCRCRNSRPSPRGRLAAGRRDGPAQDLRVGLLDAERVLAADRGKARGRARAHRAGAATALRACWCRPRSGSRRAASRSSASSRPGNGRERSAMWAA